MSAASPAPSGPKEGGRSGAEGGGLLLWEGGCGVEGHERLGGGGMRGEGVTGLGGRRHPVAIDSGWCPARDGPVISGRKPSGRRHLPLEAIASSNATVGSRLACSLACHPRLEALRCGGERSVGEDESTATESNPRLYVTQPTDPAAMAQPRGKTSDWKNAISLHVA